MVNISGTTFENTPEKRKSMALKYNSKSPLYNKIRLFDENGKKIT